MLTGEGADGLFPGWEYLQPIKDLGKLCGALSANTADLNNTNLQRSDRMTMARVLEGSMPFLDTKMVEMAFDLPAHWKLQEAEWPVQGLLRRGFSEMLPERIVQRLKQKPSDGAGSIDLMTHQVRVPGGSL